MWPKSLTNSSCCMESSYTWCRLKDLSDDEISSTRFHISPKLKSTLEKDLPGAIWDRGDYSTFHTYHVIHHIFNDDVAYLMARREHLAVSSTQCHLLLYKWTDHYSSTHPELLALDYRRGGLCQCHTWITGGGFEFHLCRLAKAFTLLTGCYNEFGGLDCPSLLLASDTLPYSWSISAWFMRYDFAWLFHAWQVCFIPGPSPPNTGELDNSISNSMVRWISVGSTSK